MLKKGSNEEENGLREIKMESSLLNKQSTVFFIFVSFVQRTFKNKHYR